MSYSLPVLQTRLISCLKSKETEARLRNWKHGGEIEDEILFEVSHGDLARVCHEIAPTEHPGAGRHEGGAELEHHVREIKQIRDGAKEGDDDADALVNPHAGGAADVHEVEVERIEEKSDEACDEEDAVPLEDDIAAGVEDAPPPSERMQPTRTLRPEGDVVPRRRRGGAEAEEAHLPCASTV